MTMGEDQFLRSLSLTPFKAHSQQQLSEHFTSLNIQRSTLLQAGRLELLFARG